MLKTYETNDDKNKQRRNNSHLCWNLLLLCTYIDIYVYMITGFFLFLQFYGVHIYVYTYITNLRGQQKKCVPS